MDSSKNSSPLLRTSDFRFSSLDKREMVVASVNAALLLMVGICGLKFIQLILTKELKSIAFVGILTAAAFIYSIIFASASVYGIEKQFRVPNITNIIRLMSVLYSFGVCIAYGIVIWKLSERDYGRTRYFQYIAILAVSFVAARLYAQIPRKQDIWVLGALIIIMNLVHATSMIFQYVAYDELAAVTNIIIAPESPKTIIYFFQDLIILLGMAGAAIYTLVGSWKV